MEIPRGKGVLKVKISEAKYEAKLEFPGGRGVQNKKTFRGYFQELQPMLKTVIAVKRCPLTGQALCFCL